MQTGHALRVARAVFMANRERVKHNTREARAKRFGRAHRWQPRPLILGPNICSLTTEVEVPPVTFAATIFLIAQQSTNPNHYTDAHMYSRCGRGGPLCPPRPHSMINSFKSRGAICPPCLQSPSGPHDVTATQSPLSYHRHCVFRSYISVLCPLDVIKRSIMSGTVGINEDKQRTLYDNMRI